VGGLVYSRNDMRWSRLPWLLVLVLLLGCGGASGPPPSSPSPLLGAALPKFERRTINSAKVSSAAGGQVVVVKFFAKYCEPCKKTLPAAERLHRDRPGVLFLGVAEDEYQADAQEMIDLYQLTFPVVHDRGNVLAGRFRVQDLPITFVADKAGVIRWVGGGTTTEADLESAIEWAETGR
jgi:cytochrome c biogenesis protein CcmG/thiol:disulfide interchange protein DsbE